MEKELTVSQIDCLFRTNVFHKLKLIAAPEMMEFSKNSQLIAQVVCAHFNVPKLLQHKFCSQYGKYVFKLLNKKGLMYPLQ